MPIAGPTPTPTNEARSIEAGMLLIGAGAILLFVSLFLEWYEPGIDAWEIFEVWDLVLALLAVTALVAVAGRLGLRPAAARELAHRPRRGGARHRPLQHRQPAAADAGHRRRPGHRPLAGVRGVDPHGGRRAALHGAHLGRVHPGRRRRRRRRRPVARAGASVAAGRPASRSTRERSAGAPVGPGTPLPGDRPTPPTEPTRRL